ncbi:MAG: hypothetical protein ABIJ08_00225 [Nanoarchaeota archaeon]
MISKRIKKTPLYLLIAAFMFSASPNWVKADELILPDMPYKERLVYDGIHLRTLTTERIEQGKVIYKEKLDYDGMDLISRIVDSDGDGTSDYCVRYDYYKLKVGSGLERTILDNGCDGNPDYRLIFNYDSEGRRVGVKISIPNKDNIGEVVVYTEKLNLNKGGNWEHDRSAISKEYMPAAPLLEKPKK